MRTCSPAPAACRLRAPNSPMICQAMIATIAVTSTPLISHTMTVTSRVGWMAVKPARTRYVSRPETIERMTTTSPARNMRVPV